MTKSVKNRRFLGRWFHTFDNGVVKWQGKILCQPQRGTYLVQLFSWIDGSL